ncbi:hypothetical protein [Novosphingobium lindaniclasticum]
MPLGFVSFPRFHFWALLLLAAIGLQAGDPIRAPLERTQGSAFSAATLDLALTSGRRIEAGHVQAVPMPPAPPRAIREIAVVRLTTLVPASPRHLQPDVRGPPPRNHPARVPDSTAPPLA